MDLQYTYFRILHTGGFTEEEIRQQRTLVTHNVLANMAAIIRAMKALSIDFEDPNREVSPPFPDPLHA